MTPDGDGTRMLRRKHNTDLARVARFRPHDVSFLCECGAVGCQERVHMRVSDYEARTSRPGAYLLAPGHDSATRVA